MIEAENKILFFNIMKQKEIVLKRISEVGYVDNFWAIQNYVLRLGAIIHILKKENGLQFSGAYGKELGKEKGLWKNYYYKLIVPKGTQIKLL